MIVFNLPNWRKGNFISRIFRIIFEKPKIKQIFGLGLPIVMILTGPISTFLTPLPAQAQTPPTVITPPAIIKTLHTFQKPVKGTISQGYHWYHPAIDIADNNGAFVYPIATGKVVAIGYQFWGYGNYVIIQHGETLTSLYAHLKTIKVNLNDEVKLDTIIGLVGSTGRSTGPHLHLEIIDNGVKINPYAIIDNL